MVIIPKCNLLNIFKVIFNKNIFFLKNMMDGHTQKTTFFHLKPSIDPSCVAIVSAVVVSSKNARRKK